MGNYLAFLRGINLGRRRPRMEQLRELFVELKLTDVETYIASGNVIFRSSITATAKLEAMIEAHLEKSLGYAVETFVRTREEIAAMVALRPFAAVDFDHPAYTTCAIFLRTAPTAAQVRQLKACATPVDEFAVVGRELYWLCRVKISDSKVWTLPAMKAVKLPVTTMRNLTTIRKLAALYPPTVK